MTMQFIQSASPTGTTASFTSIPQTFTHLQVRVFGRSSVAVSAHDLNMYTNTQSGSNMTQHILQGDGSSVTSGSGYGIPSTISQLGWLPGASSTANVFGNVIIDILDYTNTNKNKTFRSLSGYDANGSGIAALFSGMVMNTGAINALYFFVGGGGGNFSAGTRFDLYGITTSSVTGA